MVEQSGPEGLQERYRLSPATAHYLSSVDRPAGTVLKDAEKRLGELRVSEELRQQEEASSPTSKMYFEIVTEDQTAVAHLLRKAMLAVRKSPQEAQAQLERAVGLAPDYYEVHRVAVFLATQDDKRFVAKEAYERAYELAPSKESQARVAYFYSWLLSTLGETDHAITLAAEADRKSATPATSVRLAQFLMYAKRFNEAEPRLRQALTAEDSRSALIARTLLVSLVKRRIEEHRRGRRAGDAVKCGADGLRELSAYLKGHWDSQTVSFWIGRWT